MSEMIMIIVGSVLIPALAAFLICSKFKSDMQTAELKTEAGQYVDSQELYLTHKRDVFTHTTETRQRINRDNGPGAH